MNTNSHAFQVIKEHNRIRSALQAYHTTPTGWQILTYLALRDAAKMHELATYAGVSPSGLTRAMDPLVGDLFVERSLHPDDRRASSATITDAGRARLIELNAAIHTAIHGQETDQ